MSTSINNAGITKDSGDKTKWFEEDDESLLCYLLLDHHLQSEEEDDEDNLGNRLSCMLDRLEQDVGGARGIGGRGEDRWWNGMRHGAITSGFSCNTSGQPSNNRNNSSSSSGSLPKSFNTPEGQIHLRALVDLLGITEERGVKITLAALRSFASVSSPDKGSTDDGSSTDKDGGATTTTLADSSSSSSSGGGQEEKLRSLLGTKDLFNRVLDRHRHQFLARLRVVTECLRLEQEYSTSSGGDDDDEDDDEENKQKVGKSCAHFLDTLDSQTTLNGKKRGVFQLLLRLATGPSLPWMGGGSELPYSVGKLRGGHTGYDASNTMSGVIGHDESSLLAIRNEASEALLVLLYDRIDGGVQRLDLYLLMEGASSCGDFEFGMSASQYSKRGLLKARGGGRHEAPFHRRSMSVEGIGGQESTTSVEVMKHRLNGLWGLACAECMGLWRANNGNSGWVKQHPFFAGLSLSGGSIEGGDIGDTPIGLTLRASEGRGGGNMTASAQVELEALCQKLRSLGEAVRDRRQFAYKAKTRCRETDAMDEVGDQDDDDELWGVEAPEAITLLSFGLLLRLAHLAAPSNNEFLNKLGGWGEECSQMANDDCGAFAYLHRVLEGVVRDPLKELEGGLARRWGVTGVEGEKIVQDIAGRGEIQMLAKDSTLALMGESEEQMQGEDGAELLTGLAGDAASVVYASIGREILSATIRSFRQALLSLQSPSASENIGMLADLASILYRNSAPLCEQFWSDWEEFCQGNDSMEDEPSSDESMCYLLDAAHSLAVSTLVELNNGGSKQTIIKYLRPLSSFLRLIASLCANSTTVESILTSDFLPEGLIPKAMLVCATLAPLVSQLSETSEQVTSEEHSTVKYATIATASISTLAYLGGEKARNWIRQSLRNCGSFGGPRMLFTIAAYAMPRKQSALSKECAEWSSCTLNLLADLLVDADVAFQMEASGCFSSSKSFGEHITSGFTQFVSEGIQSETTLSAMSVLSCLAVNLTRDTLNTRIDATEAIRSNIETVGGGVLVGLEVLSTLFSGGEVFAPASKIQVATAHAILLSTLATLVGIKPVIYLHEDDTVREVALDVRNAIITSLTTSTALGQIVAFLATLPISSIIMKHTLSAKALSDVMETAVDYRENTARDGSKYGAWSRFVTPKRASQRARTAETTPPFNDGTDSAKGMSQDMSLCAVAEMSLSLILVWSYHAEDIVEVAKECGEDITFQSPCNLLLSKVPFPDARGLSVANLNLVSRFINVDDALSGGGTKANSALLATKIIKMCLRHTVIANELSGDAGVGLVTFRAALCSGRHLFGVLLGALNKLDNEDIYFDHMEKAVLLAVVTLETLAICVNDQSDIARTILLGGDGKEEWTLVDAMIKSVENAIALITSSNEKQQVDNRLTNLRCALACGSLQAISAIWSACRLGCLDNSNSDNHACGIIASRLASEEGTASVANLSVELTRCSLLAIMSQDERNSMQYEVSIDSLNDKSILLDLLRKSLDIMTVEVIARVQSDTQGGVNFVDDLTDSGPLECWSFLLSSSNTASLAASSWVNEYSASVGKTDVSNWSVSSFLRACPAEKDTSSTTWCSSALGTRLAKDLSNSDADSVNAFVQCNTLSVLASSETNFAASWASFFEVVAVNSFASRSEAAACTLSTSLAESTLAALSTLSQSKMMAESVLSPQGFSQIDYAKPVEELCLLMTTSLLMASVTTVESRKLLEMLDRLHESTNRLFVMTQVGGIDQV